MKRTDMYYKGSPFEPINALSAAVALKSTMYFKEKAEKTAFAGKVIETYTKGNLDLVIYVKAEKKDTRLMLYHLENYGAIMPFHVEEYLCPYTIQATIFVELVVRSSSIYHYDESWRLMVEQVYDAHNRLYEYRQWYYTDNEQTPCEEKLFLAKNWTILTEKFK